MCVCVLLLFYVYCWFLYLCNVCTLLQFSGLRDCAFLVSAFLCVCVQAFATVACLLGFQALEPSPDTALRGLWL